MVRLPGKFPYAMLLLSLASIPQANAGACKSSFTESTAGSTPPNGATEALPPFTLRCTGGISGTLDVMTGGWAAVKLRIEKENNGTWQSMVTGYSVTLMADPGTYRYVVDYRNNNEFALPATWRLRYSKPF
ncbi:MULTISPECIES: hypothetical protein [Cupriavidus]